MFSLVLIKLCLGNICRVGLYWTICRLFYSSNSNTHGFRDRAKFIYPYQLRFHNEYRCCIFRELGWRYE